MGCDTVHVREAEIDDLPAVMTVFDAALLETNVDTVRDAIVTDDVLVAVRAQTEQVLGALLLVDKTIEAVAVRRRRRDQGIGSVLVKAAANRRQRLIAEFDPGVRPFWKSLGFEIESTDESGRLRAVRIETER